MGEIGPFIYSIISSYFIVIIYMLVKRAYVTKLYTLRIRDRETHSYEYSRKCRQLPPLPNLFMILMRTVALYFLILLFIFIMREDRPHVLRVMIFVLVFLLY